MKKKTYLVILSLGLAVVLLLLLLGRNRVPAEIADTYDDFMKAFSDGEYEDIDPYIHYENPEHRQMNLENFHNIQAYQIQSWKKLNANLWVARTTVQLVGDTGWTQCYHFVGRLDGRIQIMLGAHNVPSAMADGLDLSGFVPPNALPPDTEIIPLS